MLGQFEALAWDEVTEAGGRLVKLVGDEAMFVCPPTAGAAAASLRILTCCGHDSLPPARAGLAAGPVLIRGGDYFGPVVNLASRLVDTARPDTIVVNETYRSLLEEQHPQISVEQLDSRELKGIGMTRIWRLNHDLGSSPVVSGADVGG